MLNIFPKHTIVECSARQSNQPPLAIVFIRMDKLMCFCLLKNKILMTTFIQRLLTQNNSVSFLSQRAIKTMSLSQNNSLIRPTQNLNNYLRACLPTSVKLSDPLMRHSISVASYHVPGLC